MTEKTRNILLYVGAALVIAGAVVFGVREIAGGDDEPAAAVQDSLVVDTTAVDTFAVALEGADTSIRVVE